MKLHMTDRQLIKLAIAAHTTIQIHPSPRHSVRLSLLIDELERRRWKPHTTTILTFVRTTITRGGKKLCPNPEPTTTTS